LAEEALEFIRQLYLIEKLTQRQGPNHNEIYELRQEKSKPILDTFQDWLDVKEPLTAPKGLLGKAIHYTLSNWKKLTAYINDGRLRPDNNVAENAMKST
jgi:transposase